MKTANLDRRVAVQTNAGTKELSLSSLRDSSYVVLLGEPGLGKTEALTYEALAEGGELVTCRQAMTGTPLSSSVTAYLDALDEYRSGDNSKDKLLQLANAITESNINRWRLTCRAEDWRDIADISAMKRAANNEQIIVARLLPLNEDEARSVLMALGESNPEEFLKETHTRGASAFLESPLSLRLLHSVVLAGGIWPTTRFELFDKAIWALAHEYDPERSTDPRPSVESIITIASTLCFYLLVSGAKALWRSTAIPPSLVDNEYVIIHDLDLEPKFTASALDTALFKGQGHAFQPFHKTIAEFLAGRFLAARVTGDNNTPVFPLRRATALITGNDQKAPSELRGLYAWFAAHLQTRNDTSGTKRLIEQDAATVLAYGDAAAFDTAGRKAILVNLDKEDPYFLKSQNDSTVLGGLADDALVEDFITILDADVRSHLQLTILQSLAEAPPLARMQVKLRDMALTKGPPIWMRERAARVYIQNSVDQSAAAQAMLNELSTNALDREELAIRARILSSMPTKAIKIDDFHKLLSDFNALPAQPKDESSLIETSSFTSLKIALRKAPREDFFDKPFTFDGTERGLKFQVRSLLDYALVSAIDANLDMGVDRLCEWLKNLREDYWERLDSDVVEAIQRWIDRDTNHRELKLFVNLLDDDSADRTPWMAGYRYMEITRRQPSEALVNGLFNLAKSKTRGRERKRLFQVAAYAARRRTDWPESQKEVVSILKREGRFKGFIKSLLLDPNARWKAKDARRKIEEARKKEAVRRENITSLTPRLVSIQSGSTSELQNLIWAAGMYQAAILEKKPHPLEIIRESTNEEIGSAIAEGFIRFAIHPCADVSLEDLGEAKANNARYYLEDVIAAGLHHALLHGRENELVLCPLFSAIVGLRNGYFSGKEEPSIASWAVRRLAQRSDEGAEFLLRYWNSALEAGCDDVDAIQHLESANEPKFVAECLGKLLDARPNLPVSGLRRTLCACAETFSYTTMSNLIRRVIPLDNLDTEQRNLWSFAALAVSPTEFGAQLSEDELEAALLAPDGDLARAFGDLCPQPDVLDRMRISVLGKAHSADPEDWRRSYSVSGIVRAAIRRLGASKAHNAGDILKTLARDIHPSWKSEIAHVASEHARMIRDEHYVVPTVKQLMNALSDGPPASPSDLTAVVLEEIERYGRTLRSGSETPWKRFWNTDENGAATKPQIENEDRDRLLELLRPRFEKYGIVASLPEAQRGESTRVDILLLSHAGKNLPIEAKRHYNKELWTAPLSQLAGYATDEGAFGFGIYLVFWFGSEFPLPKRPDGETKPDSATELESILIEDLPKAQKDKFRVIVLDVSRPKSMIDKTK